MGKGNLKQKKYRTSFLDYYVAILLAGVYAITPGSQWVYFATIIGVTILWEKKIALFSAE